MKLLSVLVVFVSFSALGQSVKDLPKEKTNGKIKVIRETEFRQKGGKHWKMTRKLGGSATFFADNGNETSVETIDKKDKPEYKINYSYDALGNRVAADDYHKGQLETKSTYKYDEKGYQTISGPRTIPIPVT